MWPGRRLDFIQINIPLLNDPQRVIRELVQRKAILFNAKSGFPSDAFFGKPDVAAVEANPVDAPVGNFGFNQSRRDGLLPLPFKLSFDSSYQVAGRSRGGFAHPQSPGSGGDCCSSRQLERPVGESAGEDGVTLNGLFDFRVADRIRGYYFVDPSAPAFSQQLTTQIGHP